MLSKPYVLGALLVLAFGIRTAFFFVHHAPLEFPDSVVYDRVASRVCAGEGLTEDAETAVFRPPLYPLFLAACYSTFGRNYSVVGVVQAVMGALTVLVLFYIAKLCLTEATAGVAAAVAVVYPFFVFYAALLLTETLFILLLACVMALLIRASRDLRPHHAAMAGATLGLAILARASLASFVVFVLPFWWLLTHSKGLRRSMLAYGLMVLCTLVVLTPWALRNYMRTGHVVFTTLQGGYALYEANSPEATGGSIGDRIDWAQVTEGRHLTEYERDALLRRKALAYIRAHPGRFLQLAAVKFCRFWSPIPNYEKYRSSLYNTISLSSFGPVLLLAGTGVILLRRRWREMLLLLSPVCYYSLLHMVFLGSTRYRAPVEPYLIVLAAYTASAIISTRRSRQPSCLET